MPQILTLHLVNDLGSDSIGGSQSDVPSLWPGTAVPYDFSLPPQAIRPVWVGVSLDGSTNQVYPLSTSVATIIGAGWPRVYQGTEIVGNHGDVNVFSEQYAHVLNALAACCATGVLTGAYVFLMSRYSLDPNTALPPCGTEAIFKWLAVRSAEETRTLTYSFIGHFISADTLLTQDVDYAVDVPFTETLQLVKSWSADFAGLEAYALGTLGVEVTIKEAGTPILTDLQTFRLPDICPEESSSSSSGESDSGSASASASESEGGIGFTPNLLMKAVVTEPGQLKGFGFDMLSDSTGTVNWGDGSPNEPTDGFGSSELSGSHVYAMPGTYDIQVLVDDPAGPSALQIFGSEGNQTNAYEFLDVFPNLTTINMSGASELDTFSLSKIPVDTLPALVNVSFFGCNFDAASMDTIVAQLDNGLAENGTLDLQDNVTGAIPNTGAGSYIDLTTLMGWTVLHD